MNAHSASSRAVRDLDRALEELNELIDKEESTTESTRDDARLSELRASVSKNSTSVAATEDDELKAKKALYDDVWKEVSEILMQSQSPSPPRKTSPTRKFPPTSPSRESSFRMKEADHASEGTAATPLISKKLNGENESPSSIVVPPSIDHKPGSDADEEYSEKINRNISGLFLTSTEPESKEKVGQNGISPLRSSPVITPNSVKPFKSSFFMNKASQILRRPLVHDNGNDANSSPELRKHVAASNDSQKAMPESVQSFSLEKVSIMPRMKNFVIGRSKKEKTSAESSTVDSQYLSDSEVSRGRKYEDKSPRTRQRAATAPSSSSRPSVFALMSNLSGLMAASSQAVASPESSQTELTNRPGKANDPFTPPLTDSKLDEKAFLKVYKADMASTVVQCKSDATTAQIIDIVSKKFFITQPGKYILALSYGNEERVLRADEMPLFIQHMLQTHVDGNLSFKFVLRESSPVNKELIEKNLNNASRTHISLSGANITAFPLNLCPTPELVESLDLSRNAGCIELPSDLAQHLKSLNWLSLSGNLLHEVPSTLRYVSSTLVSLNISANSITDLRGGGLELLCNLESLNLSKNLIRELPPDIASGWKQMKNLDLSYNKLDAFPTCICTFLGKSLRYLDLSFCEMKGLLPDDLCTLESLVILKLAFNRLIGGLPWNFALPDLVEIDIRGNELGEQVTGGESVVMGVLSRCLSLEVIKADGNRIRWLGRWRDRGDKRRKNSQSGAISSMAENHSSQDIPGELQTSSSNSVKDDYDSDGPVGSTRSVEFSKLKILSLSKQTSLSIQRPLVLRISNIGMTLTEMNISGSGLSELPERIFERVRGLHTLNLSGNKLKKLPPFTFACKDCTVPLIGTNYSQNRVGILDLRSLNVSKNEIEFLPPEIGDLTHLTILQVQKNKLHTLPIEMWQCGSLQHINASSNFLETFALPPASSPTRLNLPNSSRPSDRRQGSDSGMSPASLSSERTVFDSNSQRAGTFPLSRSLQILLLADNCLNDEISGTLRALPNLISLNLSLNNISDISPWFLPPNRDSTVWFSNLRELFISGNFLTSLPGDLEKIRNLRWLFVNGNRLTTVPGEVAKINRLRVFDLASQLEGSLRYNITNWPFDWNWNWNLDLRYLNLSGNQRLEIKPSKRDSPQASNFVALMSSKRDFAEFGALSKLRLLSLMDVTCLVTPPDESAIRRVRTTSSDIAMIGLQMNRIGYGVADALSHPASLLREPASPSDRALSPLNADSPLSNATTVVTGFSGTANPADEDSCNEMVGIFDLVLPRFRGRDNEALFGFFDGRGTASGNLMAKHLYDTFGAIFARELARIEKEHASKIREQVADAQATTNLDPVWIKEGLQRAFLAANRELITRFTSHEEDHIGTCPRSFNSTNANITDTVGSPSDTQGDGIKPPQLHGCSATVLFVLGPLSDDGASECSIYVANAGDGLAALSHDGGECEVLTENHCLTVEMLSKFKSSCDVPATGLPVKSSHPGFQRTLSSVSEDVILEIVQPADAKSVQECEISPNPFAEISRIRDAGGWVSADGLVIGSVDVSRALGYNFSSEGPVTARPWVRNITLNAGDCSLKSGMLDVRFNDEVSGSGDEFIVLASSNVWKALSYGGSYEDGARTIVKIARNAASSSSSKPSQASARAQTASKSITGTGWSNAAFTVRDMALGAAGGPESGMLVMVLGLREISASARTPKSEPRKSLANLWMHEESIIYKEIRAPTGRLALVFTDIKNSTALWEQYPTAMRDSIKLHNATMRRLLFSSGGYEVKTEGDAFMVAFQDIVCAVEWCFSAQLELRNVDWPQEILDSEDGEPVYAEHDDVDGVSMVLVFRGLSVRMGIHFGSPLCETDMVTGRMDYFGPMVNRSARVSGSAQGGQILVSFDAMKEIQTRIGYRISLAPAALATMSLCWKITDGENMMECSANGSRPADDGFNHLKRIGLHAWLFGEVKLKGLENPEVMYMIFPTELIARRKHLTTTTKPLKRQSHLGLRRTISSGATSEHIHIDKAAVHSLLDLCQRLELLAARSGDEWQERRASGGMWGTLAVSRHSGVASPSGGPSLTQLSVSSRQSVPAGALSPPQTFKRKSFLPSSHWLKGKNAQATDTWNIEESDNEMLIKIMVDLVGRIESSVSILYLTKPSSFSKVLKSLGEAMEDDPNHVMHALQMYASQLAEKKRIVSVNLGSPRV